MGAGGRRGERLDLVALKKPTGSLWGARPFPAPQEALGGLIVRAPCFSYSRARLQRPSHLSE
ncbi:unnamed protein product, partial [Musa textilis]